MLSLWGVLPGTWGLHMCLSFLVLLRSLFGGAVKDCRKRPLAFHHLMSVSLMLTGVHRLNSDQCHHAQKQQASFHCGLWSTAV